MSDFTEQEFNIKCAEYLGAAFTGKDQDGSQVYLEQEGIILEFDAFNDANDRNKVIEKMKLYSAPPGNGNEYWYIYDPKGEAEGREKSMEAAQNACIWKVLQHNSEKQDV